MSAEIAILDPLNEHGGIHYYVHDQAESLVANGVGVAVFSPSTTIAPGNSYSSHLAYQGVYGSAPKLTRAVRLIREHLRAIWVARRMGARVCVFHIFKSDGFEAFAVLVSRLVGMKVYCIIHDVSRLDATTSFNLMKPIVAMSNGLVVHNSFSRDALLAAAPGAARKTKVIPHGNYIDRFPDQPSETDARNRLNLPQASLILLFFGNPRHEKGLHVLLDALIPFAGRTDLLLLIAGKMKPAEEAQARSFIELHKLGSIVRLDIGHVPDDRIADYYRAASIVVLPYLRVYESGVALMSMSFSRPVLVSNLPVFEAMISESNGGIVFKSEDVGSLTNAVQSLLDNDSGTEALGRNAYSFALTERSWNRSGRLMADFVNTGV